MRGSATATRVGVALLLVVLVSAPLLWRLVSVPPPDAIVEPLTEDTTQAVGTPIRLPMSGRIAGADVFRLSLTTSDLAGLAAASEIHLVTATYATPAQLLEGWIAVEGTSCRFRTRPGAVLMDNALLAFHRQPACDESSGSPTGNLEVDLRIDVNTGRVALWAHAPPATGRVLVESEGRRYAVRGRTITAPPPNTRARIGLLAYVWDVTPAVLWARLRSIALIALLGVALLLYAPRRERRWTSVACAVTGTSAVMTALALTHALLFPPLQAPDEPIHAFSLSQLQGDREFWNQIVALGNRTHFARLRHQAFERFRERDVDRPMHEYWGIEMQFPFDVYERSPATAAWWKVIGVRGESRAVDHLWSLRRANAVLLGLFCGGAVAILALALPSRQPAAFSLAVLAVPTLPFFGGYFSDGSVIVSVSLVLAACITVLVIGTVRAAWIGLPLAAVLALVWLTGRSAWPLIAAVGAVLAGHALTGGRPSKSRPLELVVFWTPLVAATAIGVWLAERGGQFAYLDTFLRRHLPAAVAPVHAMVAGIPWLAVAAGAAFAAVQWVTARRHRPHPVSRAAVVISSALAAWIAIGFVLSLVVAPADSSSATRAESAAGFVGDVLTAMVVPFRLLDHDLLLSTFFWSGMGWVDLVAPPPVLALVIGATVVVLTWSLLEARADTARALRYLLLFAGLAVSLVIYAVGAYGLDYALYGRYLVGWYLLIIVPAWTAPALSTRDWRPWLALSLAIHAFYLQSIPARYF